jgi:hypothetical protein
VGYTFDGSDLFSVELGATGAGFVPAGRLDLRGGVRARRNDLAAADETSGLISGASSEYDAFRTLVPTYWSPIVESDAGETLIGAGTAMADALGRHAYAANAAWAGRARPDWNLAYAYDRWRPTIVASYADDTDPIRGGTVRSRELFAGVQVRLRQVRSSETLFAGFDAQRDTLDCAVPCRVTAARRDRRSLRGGWLHDTRRQFGYSIGTEEGAAVAAAVETSRTAFGSTANAGAAILDVRGFVRAFGRHTVLAARGAVAASWGDLGGRRVFSAAGPGQPRAGFDFGRDAVGLIRGLDPEDVLGTRVFTANVDLRFPIARPQRGAGLWPIFVRAVHGAVFLDAGHGWDRAFRAADVRTAAGAELSTDLVLLHSLPVTLAAGASWTRDPAADRRGASFFGRVGYSF